MRNLKTFLRLLDRSARRQVGKIAFMLLLSAPAELVGLGSIALFLGIVANPNQVRRNPWLSQIYEVAGFQHQTTFITALGTVMIAAVTFSNVLQALLTYSNLKLTWTLHQNLVIRLTEAYLRKDYIWYLSQNTSELSKNIMGEVLEVIQSVLNPFLGTITHGFRLALLVVVLIFLDPVLAMGLLLLGGGVFGLLLWYSRSRLLSYGERRRDALKSMYKSSSEMLSAVKEIKMFGGEAHLMKIFSKGVEEHGQARLAFGIISGLPRYLLQTFALAGTLMVALYLFHSGVGTGRVFTTLAAFALGGYRIMGSAQKLFTSYSSMRFGTASLDNIESELTEELPFIHPTELVFKESIRFDDVTFRYPGKEEPILSGVSFEIPKHSKVAFVGSTGAGKTTVINLLLGLLRPSSGKISVDNTPLIEESMLSWRQNIGYVPQDIFLLDDTIERNIAFAVPHTEIDHQRVQDAARLAQIDTFIEEDLAQAYETIIGERGARLSGGQRQRLGIARALYRNPELLVLDEATSALDGATESALVGELECSNLQKTFVVVAHRLQTVKRCDKIFVLRDGKIVASGTFDELLAISDDFRALAGNKHDIDEFAPSPR